MNQELKKTIEEKLTTRPKEIRETILSFNWAEIVEEIGKNNLLNTEEEISILQLETSLVLLGLTDNFEENIASKLGISPELANKISIEVFKKVFIPITNKINETIKNSLPNRSIHWQQNLNFILSGGDYTAFIKRVEEKKDEIPETNENFNPSKLDDLKSKFTI